MRLTFVIVLAAALVALVGWNVSPSLAKAPGAGGLVFRADLSGDEEVPPVDTETEGKFRIQFEDDFSSATFRLRVDDGLRVIAAHIHCGVEGMNGPVVVPLAGTIGAGQDLDGWWLRNVTITDENIVNDACGTNLQMLADAMAAGEVYVNVHTLANQSGEIRGQVGQD